MKLPRDLTLKETTHFNGGTWHGYAYEDRQGLGVAMTAFTNRHPKRGEHWFFKWLPHREFANLIELEAAIADLTDEAIKAEQAYYPQFRSVEPRLEGGSAAKCWNEDGNEARYLAHAATCWLSFCGQSALLCADCAAKVVDNPAVIIEAGDKRKAYCASLPSPLERLTGKD